MPELTESKNLIPTIDVFGFGGGLAMGMTQAGFKLIGKREGTGGFGVPMMESNRHLLGDVWQTQVGNPHEWEPLMDTPMIHANPPCSGFSLMSIRAGSGNTDYRGVNAPVNQCMHQLIEYAGKHKNLEIVMFESVQGAFKNGIELMHELRFKLESLTNQSWTLHHVLHNAASCGGSSIRARYFWIASRIPFGIEPPEIARIPTVREAIADLDLPIDNWGPAKYSSSPSFWASEKVNKNGKVDGLQTLEKTGRGVPYFKRLAGVFAAEEWLPGEQMVDVVKKYYERTDKFPKDWSLQSQATYLKSNFRGGVYQPQRWKEEKAARVLAGNAMECVIHPWNNRTLTYREVARLMGFPDSWRVDEYTSPGGEGVFGKGVCVESGKWIGEWLKSALERRPGKWKGEIIGDREHKYDVTNDYKKVYATKTGEHRDSRGSALKKEMEQRTRE
jgi:site-specific DNA-cytosine methylase